MKYKLSMIIMLLAGISVVVSLQQGQLSSTSLSLGDARPGESISELQNRIGAPDREDSALLVYPNRRMQVHAREDRAIAVTGRAPLMKDGETLAEVGQSLEKIRSTIGDPTRSLKEPYSEYSDGSIIDIYQDDFLEIHYRQEEAGGRFQAVLFRLTSEEWEQYLNPKP